MPSQKVSSIFRKMKFNFPKHFLLYFASIAAEQNYTAIQVDQDSQLVEDNLLTWEDVLWNATQGEISQDLGREGPGAGL